MVDPIQNRYVIPSVAPKPRIDGAGFENSLGQPRDQAQDGPPEDPDAVAESEAQRIAGRLQRAPANGRREPGKGRSIDVVV
ncbi:MAG: hypothetical protein AAF196_13990 [Planctomycetota bacterium]